MVTQEAQLELDAGARLENSSLFNLLLAASLITTEESIFMMSKAECDICMDFDTNKYPNIFVSRKWHERISEYICMEFFDTNEFSNIFVSKFLYEQISKKYLDQKYLNIRIYSSLSGLD